ncbi:MFS transporter [Proteiniclasticum sp. BAD-10]|uniref:MFS transporter n=1 Tax=Proteiniclasticum sediminis TaxID=2804028 RepID=A0A941CQH4_9CLOT|nr:MFS transporter [Proteiniclasticum sediminis]MBR0577025.1 MFS transporter [Proteiniclasticum sediminis]
MTKEERSWILQDFGNSAYSITITTAILPLFFKGVAAANLSDATSTAYWGYANSISTLLIALLAPLLGTIADFKGVKKKLFTTFTLVAILSSALLATVGEGQWVYALIIYIITAVAFNGSSIYYDAFLTDVTTDDRMDDISAKGFGFGYLGGTIPFIISLGIILSADKLGLTGTFATQLAFVITAVWWLIFTLPMLRNVKQKYFIEGKPSKIRESFQTLAATAKEILGNKIVFYFMVAYFFYIDGVHTVITMATAYGVDVGVDSNRLLIILVAIQIVAFPFAILYGKLAKRFGARNMIMAGILTYVVISIYGFFLKTELDFWVLAMLVASAQGGIQALSRSYFGKIIPKNKSAEYFSIFNIFGKVSSIFGPLLMGVVASLTGETRYGILSLIILFILGAFFFLKVKDEKHVNLDLS